MRRLLPVGVLFLSSCGVPCQEQCNYVGKRYEPAHSYQDYDDICVSWDKNFICTMNIPFPKTVNVPDRYYMTFVDKTGRREELSVTREEYAAEKPTALHTHYREACTP